MSSLPCCEAKTVADQVEKGVETKPTVCKETKKVKMDVREITYFWTNTIYLCSS